MIEKTFLNPTTNKQWRIEIDGHTIRTCPNGGKNYLNNNILLFCAG